MLYLSFARISCLISLLTCSVGLTSSGSNSVGNFARWNEPQTVANKNDPQKKLLIQIYKTLSHSAVVDWTISLADKDRMKTCSVNYSAHERKTTIDPFMPKTRTFLLENLSPGQDYKLNMSCIDTHGKQLTSDLLEFSTKQTVTQNPNSSADLVQVERPSLNYLSEMIHNYPSLEEDDIIKVSSTSSMSRQKSTKPSPHVVLGVACAIFGAIVVLITLALVSRRYSQSRRTQNRLWELQTIVMEPMDSSSSSSAVPSLSYLPPPYSEEPSPVYDLCASSLCNGYSQNTSNLCCSSTATDATALRPSIAANNRGHCIHHHHVCSNNIVYPHPVGVAIDDGTGTAPMEEEIDQPVIKGESVLSA